MFLQISVGFKLNLPDLLTWKQQETIKDEKS